MVSLDEPGLWTSMVDGRYVVSPAGRVVSLMNPGSRVVFLPGFERRFLIHECGEIWCTTTNRRLRKYLTSDKRFDRVQLDDGKMHIVHLLVARAFGLERAPGERNQVTHLDGNNRNNHISNLCYLPPSRAKIQRREKATQKREIEKVNRVLLAASREEASQPPPPPFLWEDSVPGAPDSDESKSWQSFLSVPDDPAPLPGQPV